jgi:hypothetical protein
MAVLAAAHTGDLRDTAARMVRTRDTIEPRPGSGERFGSAYLTLVDELERRGWLESSAAAHARDRSGS